jgi:CRP/FNR family transcriptional regulator/CRP/FNR family cyclic AMP-dependent transcriptional regulator
MLSGMDHARVTRSLRNCSLFEAVPEPTVAAVAVGARRRQFRRGEVIFHQDDPGETLHVIDRGKIKITLVSPDGNEAILAILGQGAFFGELALLDAGPRSATAQAMEPTETLEVTRSGLALLLDDSAARDRVLLRVAAEIRRSARQIERLRFYDLAGRVALHIADLAAEAGDRREDGAVVVTLPYGQADLAALVGATRQGVNRIIRELEHEGLVVTDGRAVTIPDIDRLVSRANA